jgi:hypothetical protein
VLEVAVVVGDGARDLRERDCRVAPAVERSEGRVVARHDKVLAAVVLEHVVAQRPREQRHVCGRELPVGEEEGARSLLELSAAGAMRVSASVCLGAIILSRMAWNEPEVAETLKKLLESLPLPTNAASEPEQRERKVVFFELPGGAVARSASSVRTSTE